MNTNTQPDTTQQHVTDNVDIPAAEGLPVSRWEIHYGFWLITCCMLGVCIGGYFVQHLINELPPEDHRNRQSLCFVLIFFYTWLLVSCLSSLALGSNKKSHKPIDYRSKRFIVYMIAFGVIIIPLLVFAIANYLSSTPPSNWPFDVLFGWLINLLPNSTPTWEAFWQSIARSRLSIILIACIFLMAAIRDYCSELKTFSEQKNVSND